MRKYELVTVFSPDLTGEKLKKAVGEVEKLIADVKGKIGKTTAWGKKDLAYLIDGRKQGHYYLHQLELAPEAPGEIEKQMRLNDNLLRYLLVSQ